MSDKQEKPEQPRTPAKICPECVGEPIHNSDTCPRCNAELMFPAQLHQRNVQRAFRPDPPNETTHTF